MSFYKISTSACLLIFVLVAFTGSAQASDISFFVGAEMPGSVEHKDMKMPLDNGPVFGLRYGNDFVRYLGLEHTFAYSPDFMFPSNNDCGSTEAAQACWEEAKGFIYNSNLLLNFPDIDDRMVPFLTAGVGFVHQYGDRNLPVGTKLAFNYGGGVKLPNLAGPLGARVDLRGYRAGIISKSVNMIEISVGVMVSFGR